MIGGDDNPPGRAQPDPSRGELISAQLRQAFDRAAMVFAALAETDEHLAAVLDQMAQQ